MRPIDISARAWQEAVKCLGADLGGPGKQELLQSLRENVARAIDGASSFQVAPLVNLNPTDELAAFLCSEFDEDFMPDHKAHWPEDANDDGKREGGYVAIQSKHVQAHAREQATRILAFLTAYELRASTAGGVKAEPDFTRSIADVMKEEGLGGAACGWRSCTGCHETNEGYETGHYPYSAMFQAYVGSGCGECGGLGVVWEYWSATDLSTVAKDLNVLSALDVDLASKP